MQHKTEPDLEYLRIKYETEVKRITDRFYNNDIEKNRLLAILCADYKRAIKLFMKLQARILDLQTAPKKLFSFNLLGETNG